MIEEILPHPFAELNMSSDESIKENILKTIGAIVGKEAAGKKLNFDGDMWKMLDW